MSRRAAQWDRRWGLPSQGLGVFTGLSPPRAVPQSPGGPYIRPSCLARFTGTMTSKILLARSASAGARQSKGRILPKSTPLWGTKVCCHGWAAPLRPGVRPQELWAAPAPGRRREQSRLCPGKHLCRGKALHFSKPAINREPGRSTGSRCHRHLQCSEVQSCNSWRGSNIWSQTNDSDYLEA